jgi:hypothetical protein
MRMALSTHDSRGPIGTHVVTLSLQLVIFWLKWRCGRVPRGTFESNPEERR